MRLRGWGCSQVPPVPGTLVGMGKQAGHVAGPPTCGWQAQLGDFRAESDTVAPAVVGAAVKTVFSASVLFKTDQISSSNVIVLLTQGRRKQDSAL